MIIMLEIIKLLGMNMVPNLKYKTTMCHNYEQGKPCIKQKNCFFAHGEKELRTIQQNRDSIIKKNDQLRQSVGFSNYKTIYCKFYSKGECKLGKSCSFIHQRQQKRQPIKKQMNWQEFSYYCWLQEYKKNQPINYFSAELEKYEQYFQENFNLPKSQISSEKSSPPSFQKRQSNVKSSEQNSEKRQSPQKDQS